MNDGPWTRSPGQTEVVARRIADEVFLVGGGPTLAFGLSNDPDCHVYLMDGGDELALVERGVAEGGSLEGIASNVAAECLDRTRISTLLRHPPLGGEHREAGGARLRRAAARSRRDRGER